MNWKRWKIGLIVAGITGALTAAIALDLNVGWKPVLILAVVNVAKDCLLYLKDHPVEQALDSDPPQPIPQPKAIRE